VKCSPADRACGSGPAPACVETGRNTRNPVNFWNSPRNSPAYSPIPSAPISERDWTAWMQSAWMHRLDGRLQSAGRHVAPRKVLLTREIRHGGVASDLGYPVWGKTQRARRPVWQSRMCGVRGVSAALAAWVCSPPATMCVRPAFPATRVPMQTYRAAALRAADVLRGCERQSRGGSTVTSRRGPHVKSCPLTRGHPPLFVLSRTRPPSCPGEHEPPVNSTSCEKELPRSPRAYMLERLHLPWVSNDGHCFADSDSMGREREQQAKRLEAQTPDSQSNLATTTYCSHSTGDLPISSVAGCT